MCIWVKHGGSLKHNGAKRGNLLQTSLMVPPASLSVWFIPAGRRPTTQLLLYSVLGTFIITVPKFHSLDDRFYPKMFKLTSFVLGLIGQFMYLVVCFFYVCLVNLRFRWFLHFFCLREFRDENSSDLPSCAPDATLATWRHGSRFIRSLFLWGRETTGVTVSLRVLCAPALFNE